LLRLRYPKEWNSEPEPEDDENNEGDPPEEDRGLIAVNINEFLKMEFPPRENVLGPWLPTQGLAMIHAKRGVGKTFIGLDIAVAVSSGGEFWRWQAPEPRGVLYLDGEMPAITMQKRLARITSSVGKEPVAPLRLITPDLQTRETPNLMTLKGQKRVEDHLDGIELVVVDSISTLCLGMGESDADAWLPVQSWALKLRRRGISILFFHHSGKGACREAPADGKTSWTRS
jgi:RecA-family ATPase